MANTPTVYVICDANCKWEGMTKEQIYTAIAQAVSTGRIRDIDTGFIQTIKTINGTPLKFFVGTQAEYDVLSEGQKQNLFAIITNDTAKEGITATIETLQNALTELERLVMSGDVVAKEAESAYEAARVRTEIVEDSANIENGQCTLTKGLTGGYAYFVRLEYQWELYAIRTLTGVYVHINDTNIGEAVCGRLGISVQAKKIQLFDTATGETITSGSGQIGFYPMGKII
jgi:hypothetical protein